MVMTTGVLATELVALVEISLDPFPVT